MRSTPGKEIPGSARARAWPYRPGNCLRGTCEGPPAGVRLRIRRLPGLLWFEPRELGVWWVWVPAWRVVGKTAMTENIGFVWCWQASRGRVIELKMVSRCGGWIVGGRLPVVLREVVSKGCCWWEVLVKLLAELKSFGAGLSALTKKIVSVYIAFISSLDVQAASAPRFSRNAGIETLQFNDRTYNAPPIPYIPTCGGSACSSSHRRRTR